MGREKDEREEGKGEMWKGREERKAGDEDKLQQDCQLSRQGRR